MPTSTIQKKEPLSITALHLAEGQSSPTPLKLKNMLEASTLATSGDNCQPWRFLIKDSKSFDVWLDEEKDKDSYNVEQIGSMLALGATIENARVVCEEKYKLRFHWKANPKKTIPFTGGVVASCSMGSPQKQTHRKLLSAIQERHTNRESYNGKPLSESKNEAIHHALLDLKSSFPKVNVNFMGIESRSSVAKIISKCGSLFFDMDDYRQDLLKVIRLGCKEPNEEGLPISTLGLNAFERFWMKAYVKSDRLAKVSSILAAGKLMALHDRKLILSSSSYCMFSVSSLDAKTILEAGSAVQRFWLYLTEAGLSVQPMNATMIHAQRYILNKADMYSAKQLLVAKQAAKWAMELGEKSSVLPVFFFRIGQTSKRVPRSSRVPLSRVLL